VQHLAWLHAAPDDNDRTPRIDTLPEDSVFRMMPEVSADYLLEELNKIGIVSSGSNGLAAISWQDIAAYQSQTFNLLNAWECECLVDMSRAYLRQYNSKDVEPPFIYDEQQAEEEARKAEALKMKKAFGLA